MITYDIYYIQGPYQEASAEIFLAKLQSVLYFQIMIQD